MIKWQTEKFQGFFEKSMFQPPLSECFFSGKYEQLELKKNPPILGMGPGGIPMLQG